MNEIFQAYRIVEQLAAKKYSTLYRAHSLTDPARQVVIKIFISSRLRSEQEWARFLRESSVLKQLDYAHILPLIDAGVAKEHPYVVSPYVPAGSLRDYLDEARLSAREALHLLVQVGKALAYAHKWEVIHGNLKPENILFAKGRRAMLTDFTLPNTIDAHQPGYRPDVRSALYMAPEQFSGIVDETSEQYALGCLTYELLTGHVPFAGAAFSTISTKHLKEIPLPLSQHVPGISTALEQAVLKALEKDPAHRYRSIALFLQALTTVFDEHATPAFGLLVPTASDMQAVVNKGDTAPVVNARITRILPVPPVQPASAQLAERRVGEASSPTIPVVGISASTDSESLTTNQSNAVSLFQTHAIEVPTGKMAIPSTRSSMRRRFALASVFFLFILSGTLLVRLLNTSNTSALTEVAPVSPVASHTNTNTHTHASMSGSTLGLPLNTPTPLPTPTPSPLQATMPAQPQGLGPILPAGSTYPVSTPTQPSVPTATPTATPMPKPTPHHTPAPTPKPSPKPTATPVPSTKPTPTPSATYISIQVSN